ncbi:MAG: ribosomal-protein-alanine N-acetyltransferase RimI, partial [Acidimicrobiia bacterium]
MADVIAVRPLVAEDVEAAVEIEQDTYPQPWTEGIFRDELAQPHRVYLGAEVAGRLAGYGG